MKRLIILTMLLVASITSMNAQVGIRTNFMYWATTTPNLSVDVAFNQKNTLGIGGGVNPFRLSSVEKNKKLQHWIGSIEWRHWIYEKFDGHFLGVNVLGGSYNAGGVKLPLGIWSELKDHRFEGYMGGIGLNYGYQWVLNDHWNIEASFGFGYAYLNHDKYECVNCGDFIGKEIKHFFGPTRVSFSVVYLIKYSNY